MHTATQAPPPRQPGASARDESLYNYDRFQLRTLAEEIKLLRHREDPGLGEPAPDFALSDTDGKLWRLSELRGKPVVLVIASGTCPLTQGSLPGLLALHEEFRERCTWLMLYVREAHPGENMPAHRDYEQKRVQAEHFKNATGTPWPILIDELDGRVHKAYGLLPNATFLLDADGKVSFIGEISHAPTLHRALEHLFAQDMRGPVPEGDDKMLHMLGPTAYGWPALQRGGRASVRDMAARVPPLVMALWLGHQMKALLDPLARRPKPLERTTKMTISLAVAATAVATVYALTRSRRR